MHKITRAAVAVVSGAAMTATVTVAAEMPASAASNCPITFNSYGLIKAGTTGTQTKGAQCLIRSAGYSVTVDGSFSYADAAQLKRFQVRHAVPYTGQVDSRSWQALLSRGSAPTLHRGSRGASVKRLQRSLRAAGYHVHTTGYFGPITQNIVKSVQRARGWRPTGTVTPAFWRLLQSGGARQVARRAAPAASYRGSSKGERALAFAKRQIGDRYVWGASGPNAWDCSGLTRGAWSSVGVNLPHNARQQFSRGRHISRSQLRPGDLVFFYSGIRHVGIYAGGGMVIHAARPGKPVGYSKISYMPYEGARRPG